MINSFPADSNKTTPHLTAFLGYKAGMTHVVREMHRMGSKSHKKEVVEPVTILETPAMAVIGIVGYIETPKGLRALTTVWADHISDEAKRRFYANWSRGKKKAFTRYVKQGAKSRDKQLERIIKHCAVVRVIAHSKISLTGLRAKKSTVMEVQINGGSNVAQKVAYAKNLLEKDVTVDQVFRKDLLIDTIGVTKGKGFEGVTTRWGTKKLPRKTRKGLRKVACIGPWHPARISYAVPRAGQNGYHHRTEMNKKIFKIGKSMLTEEGRFNGSTDSDLTKKTINPMGGFPHYGIVKNDYLMLRGSVVGSKKRPVTLRLSCHPTTTKASQERINLKWIDTSSKLGHGRFQTQEERNAFIGSTKARPQ